MCSYQVSVGSKIEWGVSAMGYRYARFVFLVIILVSVASQGSYAAENLVKTNADFASGLQGWELYGQDKDKIKLGEGQGPGGSNCAVVPSGRGSISQGLVLKPGKVFELSFKYLRTEPGTKGNLDFFFNKPHGINASAGRMESVFPHKPSDAPTGEWVEFREAFRTPAGTQAGKLILSSDGIGEIRFARIAIVELSAVPENKTLLPSTDLSFLPNVRTKNPLFQELLSDKPGNYTVIAWTHNLNMKNLPDDMQSKYTEETWKQEVAKSFEEAGDAHMYYYWLPGHRDEAPEMYKKYGIKFDISCETSAVPAAAIKQGAEVLNPIASSTASVRENVSLVDPVYVKTETQTIRKLAEEFKGQPYVFVYQGKDEPSVHLPEGPVSTWGPFAKKSSDEVLNQYGYGKYAMPAPGDPAYQKDEANQPYRWIAFNRWMAQKYADSKKVYREALRAVDPNAKYNACDFWFMSGFVPYDFALMGKYSDIVESDPYASSGERVRGRGLYNHGFGPKFLRDITGKPVRSVVQAFDYAGYEMTPGDLLEWVSQSMRSGASHISYYQMDNPKYTDPDRWKMMLYISKVITGIKAIKYPTDPEVAVLYSSDSYRSQGPSTHANEIYTAYSLLGERAGSWFDFVDDDSLGRGEKSLSKYRAVYIPLGLYERPSVVKQIEDFVKRGGTVICGDPQVFSHAPDGSDLSEVRERIFGVKVLGAKSRDAMTIGKSAWTGSASGLALPIYRAVGEGGWYEDNGCAVKTVRSGVDVLAKFADGSPAITVAKYGRGQAVYFAANPFIPECLCEGKGWDTLFRAFQQHLGAKIHRPIWRFKIPSP